MARTLDEVVLQRRSGEDEPHTSADTVESGRDVAFMVLDLVSVRWELLTISSTPERETEEGREGRIDDAPLIKHAQPPPHRLKPPLLRHIRLVSRNDKVRLRQGELALEAGTFSCGTVEADGGLQGRREDTVDKERAERDVVEGEEDVEMEEERSEEEEGKRTNPGSQRPISDCVPASVSGLPNR
jgi:hypothetical protein